MGGFEIFICFAYKYSFWLFLAKVIIKCLKEKSYVRILEEAIWLQNGGSSLEIKVWEKNGVKSDSWVFGVTLVIELLVQTCTRVLR